MDYLSVIDPFVLQVQSETLQKILKVCWIAAIYLFIYFSASY